jgi:4-hydroxy-tetrahydrodipicolinate synthase
LLLGADGLLSGMGSVTADLHGQLFEAIERSDLTRAREINDRLFPLCQVFYAPPRMDQHNRMKEALVMLGRQKQAIVRPPLAPLENAEKERIYKALLKADLISAVQTASR